MLAAGNLATLLLPLEEDHKLFAEPSFCLHLLRISLHFEKPVQLGKPRLPSSYCYMHDHSTEKAVFMHALEICNPVTQSQFGRHCTSGSCQQNFLATSRWL